MLIARGVKGAVILGVLAATALGLIFGVLSGPDGIVDAPGSDGFSTIGDGLDPSNLADALTVALIPVIFALFMTDFFDTIGTAVAVGRGAGLTDEQGHLPNTDRLLLVDSAAASFGGAMGTSSVTTYVESGAGVAEGARTGLSSLVVAALFALAIFFVPIIALVGQDVKVGEDTFIHPAIAPALVMVGYLMIRIVADIDWSVPENSIPAFLTIAGIPLDVLDRGRHRARRHLLRDRDGRVRQGAGDPPADVGDRPVLRGLLRGGLAERERVLGRDERAPSTRRGVMRSSSQQSSVRSPSWR